MLRRKKGYVVRSYLQLIQWMEGLSLHNEIDDECCPDFTCCINVEPDDKRSKKIVWDYFMEMHLDKIREMTENKMQPKVIIRVAIGSKKPFSAGPQHTQDHTEAIKLMLTDVDIILLNEPEDIFPAFEKAYNRTDGKSTLVIEYSEYYGTK